ncbi:hypothetical protein KUTeg_011105 [Tegillarca granosa]|uniref:EF-hand domain-containing protein n=1 Tax=Tegillarca granosa TaxID=220873 RepID=A0ABQ9F2W6_TEGGR|nr:hypothetical protein KUTeg_011105 [Tegillarca granosa]
MATKEDLGVKDEVDNESTDSDSSSTSEEERLRQLFNSCDGDNDGYLDGNDFIFMCQRLNMEESAQEIMENLGMTSPESRITFLDFLRCRTQVMSENYLDETGAHSCKPDSLDYDSGARDLSPEPSNIQQLTESSELTTPEKITDDLDTNLMSYYCLTGKRGVYVHPEPPPKPRPPSHSCRRTWSSFHFQNYTNGKNCKNSENEDDNGCCSSLCKYLHLAALTSLKGDIIDLTQRLQHSSLEKEGLEKQLNKSQTEKLRVQRDYEDKLEQTTSRYEERITELHSVIAELRKKIERHQINVIKEEDEEDDCDVAAQSTKKLENTIDEKKRVASVSVQAVEDNVEYPDVDIAEGDSSIEEKALEEIFEFETSPEPPSIPPRGLRPATFHPPPPPPPNEFPEPAYLQEEINSLRTDNSILQEQIAKQESDLNIHRAAIGSIREERDMYKRKLAEIQSKLQSQEISSSPQQSRTSTPTKSQYTGSGGTTGVPDRGAVQTEFPVAKVAELKKLKTCASDRQVHGAEISSTGECSNMQEIVQTLYKCGSENSETKVKEFEIQFEMLQSKIDNLKSQNDLLNLTLEESKALTDRLSVLIGKYESNSTALQLALNYSDQAMEIYDVIYMLLEIDISLGGGSFTKSEERRLKEYIQHLKNERSSVKQTIMELESVHIDQECIEPSKNVDVQRIDLENAVLMQELMAIKEEKAELRAQNYLLEKEKRSLELRLSGKESQEQAYLVQIDHLKSEVREQGKGEQDGENKDEVDDVTTPTVTLAELRSHDPSDIAQDLSEAFKREKKLKSRVQELVVTLEKLSRNSEIRHQQSADFINDLKRANSALISAFDKAKKKYQNKLKRLELQIQILTDRYETQMEMLKQRLMEKESVKSRPAPNETSL